MDVSIIIPAYNEAAGVKQTADALQPVLEKMRQEYNIEVVFVNDGSRDNTAALLEEIYRDVPDVQIVSHESNLGMGAAIRTGFSHSRYEYIITTDFDGTYSFDNIPLLLQQLRDEQVDLVTASPYHPHGQVEGVPGYRLLFSFGASLLYRLLLNWNIYTWTAVFRAYRRKLVETVPCESNDFLINTELLVNAIRAGYRVSEFPTILRARTFGQSSIKVFRLTMRHLRFQLGLLWLKLTGRFLLKVASL